MKIIFFDVDDDYILNSTIYEGLTDTEVKEYESLKKSAQKFGILLSFSKNKESDKLFDDAVNALTDFEIRHNITSISK